MRLAGSLQGSPALTHVAVAGARELQECDAVPSVLAKDLARIASKELSAPEQGEKKLQLSI